MSRKKLGKYEIIERIGRGGMAEVYRGYHAALDRYVAIKLLHPFLADDPEFKDRFENEARNVARLKHPNIVQVYDFDYDEEGESYYMVMELINGPTLKDRLFDLGSTNGKLPTSETIRIIKSAAEALAYAHQRGMIHRDVKPANLMLDEDGRVVLTDFGIAKIVSSAQFTASGGMVGTPAYMAPEQGLGEAGDERSDIYSLGVILYQLAAGRLPYDADTPLAIILKHVNEPLPKPSHFMPGLPEDLEKIVCKVLEKEPEDRYQTAIQFAQDLSLLDDTGRRRAMFDAITGLATDAIPSPFDTRPDALTATQRAILAAAGENIGLNETTPIKPVVPPADTTLPTRPDFSTPVPRTGASGRLRPTTVISLSIGLIALVLVGLAGFGGDKSPFFGLFNTNKTDTPAFTGTAIAGVSPVTVSATSTIPNEEPSDIPVNKLTPTRGPTRQATSKTPVPPAATLTPTQAETSSFTATPSPTLTLTPPPSDTPTLTITPTLTLTETPTPTPSPNLTGTALANFFATQAAATPTPNMTQTLSACDFQYIVVQPDKYDRPPSANDSRNPRLIPAASNFTFDIVFQNVGNCDWPTGARLTYNEELTLNPDNSVNMDALKAECPNDLRPGLNFARQQQPNFYLSGGAQVMGETAPLTFIGTAPSTFGCYYGVWDLLYPNSNVTLGRPLLLTIRVWGSG